MHSEIKQISHIQKYTYICKQMLMEYLLSAKIVISSSLQISYKTGIEIVLMWSLRKLTHGC